jgi:6-phosphogluconolactonase
MTSVHDVRVFDDAESVAVAAADYIAEQARRAIQERDRFTFAVSGGTTPWRMLSKLCECSLPWERVHLFQVDERLAPDGDTSRNLTHIRASLASRWGQLADRVHAIPIGSDPNADVEAYASLLGRIAGTPPVLDLIHLGLGDDGHTASLVPNDPATKVSHSDVALTQPYRGQRRITVTFPLLNRARQVVWVVVGADKRAAAQRLLAGDRSIPAACVNTQRATLMGDRAALSSAQSSRAPQP